MKTKKMLLVGLIAPSLCWAGSYSQYSYYSYSYYSYSDSFSLGSGQVSQLTSSTATFSQSVKTIYAKAQTLTGICSFKGYDNVGTITIKTSKINSKTGAVKVSATVAIFDCYKKYSGSASMTPDDDGMISGSIKFKTEIGEADFNIRGEVYEDEKGRNQLSFRFEGWSDEGYEFHSAEIGGPLEDGVMYCTAHMSEYPDFGECWEMVAALETTPVNVSRGSKLSCGKAPTLKFKRCSEDGETWYELDGLEDAKKPNVCGLALTYTPATGAFKGSYYIYFANMDCATSKPTLKKVKAIVSGVVIDGSGSGYATVKVNRKTYSWPISLEYADCDECGD